MEGYVSLHRRIREHWICDNPVYFRSWLFMLMITNYKEGKLLLGGNVYTIKRGQSSLSVRSWALELGMSTKAVETFFRLLESDGMIKKSVIGKGKHSTTLITIENYDQYQHLSETLGKREGIAMETQGKHEGDARGVQYNKGNKENKENKDNNIPTLEEFVDYALSKKPNVKIEDVRLRYNAWLESGWCTNSKGKIKEILNWKSTLNYTLPYMAETTQQRTRISV